MSVSTFISVGVCGESVCELLEANSSPCLSLPTVQFESMLCLGVAHKKKISVFLWAPRPYHKFMIYKEFTVPQKPLKVHISVDEDDQLRLVYASRTGLSSGMWLLLHCFALHPPPPPPPPLQDSTPLT